MLLSTDKCIPYAKRCVRVFIGRPYTVSEDLSPVLEGGCCYMGPYPFHCHACQAVTRKTTNKSARFETIRSFLPPSHEHMKGFLSKCTALKVDLLQDHQIYCSEAFACASACLVGVNWQ